MEFLKYLFGEQSFSFYLAALVFLILGQLTNKIIVYTRRNYDSDFSIKYWLMDNWLDLVLTFILAFVTIRFTNDIVGTVDTFIHVDLSYVVDKMFYYFIVGLSWQSLLHWLRKKIAFIRLNIDGAGNNRGVRPNGTPLSNGKNKKG